MDALNYILLVNIYLVLFYAFYALLLRNETFFKLNRIYLVGGAILSFIIPFMQVDWIRSLFITKQVEEVTQNISITFSGQNLIVPAQQPGLETSEIITLIYFSGVSFCLVRFLWRLHQVRVALKSAKPQQAFSFFNQVKVGGEVPDRETVYNHELIHARQLHSADVILFEIIGIVNWFNPVVYLYRKAIKYIHEFTADEAASRNEASKAAYAMVLLSKKFGIPTHQLTNSFYNQSLLKRRIIMLHKSKSTRNALLKYGLSAPLFAGMMVLSSATISQQIQKSDPLARSKEISKASGREQSTFGLVREDLAPAGSIIESNTQTKTLLQTATTSLADTLPKNEPIFTQAETPPQFPGGMAEFYKYLAKNFRYPASARKSNVSGRIILKFIVEKSGQLTEVEVLKGIDPKLDKEAKRVLVASPVWKPGIQNGKEVRVAYTLPIQINKQGDGAAQSNQNLEGFSMIPREADPLIMVDGKEGAPGVLKTLDQSTIKAVNVLKGDKAIEKYGEKAKDGAIEIYINSAAPKKADVVVVEGRATQAGPDSKSTLSSFKGLIIVDGVEISNSALENIDSNNVESMNVLKGESALKKYGAKGKDGAVEITTKKK